MGCGGCRGNGNRHNNNTADLRKFAYLNPRQLRYLKSLEGDIDADDNSKDIDEEKD